MKRECDRSRIQKGLEQEKTEMREPLGLAPPEAAFPLKEPEFLLYLTGKSNTDMISFLLSQWGRG